LAQTIDRAVLHGVGMDKTPGSALATVFTDLADDGLGTELLNQDRL
jgi:hypothetical protein